MTGLEPGKHGVRLHWRANIRVRIPGTAVAADLDMQTPATFPVTHYYDERRTCRTCKREFIFFAREQKHWYEVLGFKIDADCVQCHPCRRERQSFQRLHERYDDLVTKPEQSAEECVELAALTIELMKAGVFATHQQTFDRIRMWLNHLAKHGEFDAQRQALALELKSVEAQQHQPPPPSQP